MIKIKNLFLALALMVLSSMAVAQDTKVTRKIAIRSADPMLIAMLLSGNPDFLSSPVPTSLMRLGNSTSGGFGGMNGGGLTGGRGNGL